MMVFPLRIKHTLNVAVQRPHDTAARNMVGPPDVLTRIKASVAACHSWASCSAPGSFVMLVAGILKGEEIATARQRYWIFETSLPAAVSHRPRSARAAASS
jgi:hypothetical protein